MIYIADSRILAIPIKECHEPLVDVKEERGLLYGPVPECELTQNDYTKMRKSVFERLLRAQEKLPQAWFFRLYEGFRSLTVQQMLFDREYERAEKLYPDRDHAFLFHEATRMASPVINLDGSQNIPAHNTGAAVDLEIVDANGALIDMGMEVKNWQIVDVELSLTQCKNISEAAQANRKTLLTVMESEGFVNYFTEWWHFSYGDRYWAYHKHTQQALYGSADSKL